MKNRTGNNQIKITNFNSHNPPNQLVLTKLFNHLYSERLERPEKLSTITSMSRCNGISTTT